MDNPFEEIFNEAFLIKKWRGKTEIELFDLDAYEQRFVWWLQESKGLQQGNGKQYQKKFLKSQVFQEFLDQYWNKVEKDEFDKLVAAEAKKYEDAFDARFKVEGEAAKRILLQRESENYEKLFDHKLLELKEEPLNRKDSPLKAVKELEELSSFNIWEIRNSYDFIKECEAHGSFYATPQNIRVLALSKYREYLIEKREGELKRMLIGGKGKVVKTNIGKNQKGNKFSHKQIAIAYHVMGIQITPKNADEILKKYPNIKSIATLLRKRVYRASDLTKVSENKSTDTKHLEDLKAAKRLVIGKKNKKAETDIERIITAFETAYEKQYQK